MAVGTVLAVLWLAPTPADGRGERPALRVVVYDYVGIAAAVLERTRLVVDRVFGEIGVDVIWMDVAQFTREMPDDPRERRAFVLSVTQVRLLPPAMVEALKARKDALAGAVPGTGRAWVSLAGVEHSARLTKADVSDVLGYVIAHEIAHLLLHPDSHSGTGLMRENLDPHLIARNRLSFLSQEATRIRARLATGNP
jgi:hypothetical protein